MKILSTLDMSSQRIQGLASPSAGTDATNKDYVDNMVNGLAWKAPVRVATTTNGTLATAYTNGQTVDGKTLVTGNRILIKDQTAGAENGIYTVNASGAPTRATDMDVSAESVNNTTVMVQEGTANGDKSFTLSNDGTITLGTTALTWVQVGGGSGSTYVAGAGLAESPAGTFNVGSGTGITVNADNILIDTAVVVRKYAAAIGNGSLTSIAVAHNLGTRDITWSVQNASTYEFVMCDGVATDANTLTLTFGTAPASGAYRVVVHG